ncbi:hypothetical protein F5884DRAFT_747822 [Xylogone sp. PMI_703]|nr:hypothetical protein F5884DRAFT_747822 [Xylogone sp. PMI_703]
MVVFRTVAVISSLVALAHAQTWSLELFNGANCGGSPAFSTASASPQGCSQLTNGGPTSFDFEGNGAFAIIVFTSTDCTNGDGQAQEFTGGCETIQPGASSRAMSFEVVNL